MEHIYFHLSGQPDEYSLQQLRKLLHPCGVTVEIIQNEAANCASSTLSSVGISAVFTMKLSYDNQLFRRFANRNAGRHSLDAAETLSVAEVEDMIQRLGAIETARQLGFSRATLFRRLKKAKENGYTLIW